MTADVAHEPITRDRQAEMVVEILRYPSRAWSALNAPGNYRYEPRDHNVGIDLDTKCDDLRLAFFRADDWRTAMTILERLIQYDDRRRRISVAVVIDGREYIGESL